MSIPALKPHPLRSRPTGPVTLVVMDGVGEGSGGPEDAVATAHTPTLDWLRTLRSYMSLCAHGRAVGMPSDKDMGNSEVGHNALGAGRVFEQGAALVGDAIASGRIYDGDAWRECVARARESGQPMHFVGLLSDGNVHSHIEHLESMLNRAATEGVKAVRVHALLDGRDVAPRSALTYVARLEATLTALRERGVDALVASGGGRMRITMDRYEADWEMVRRGWDVHVRGEGRPFHSLEEAVRALYDESDATDQDLEPFVIVDAQGPVGTIEDGASVVFFNFRGDRAIEISRAFEDERLSAFERPERPSVCFAGMMEYDGDQHIPTRFLVNPPRIDTTMSELLVGAKIRQFAIAETQKFGHVTYFWNGNRSGYFDEQLERYEEIPSSSTPEELAPEMQAEPVTDRLLQAMSEGYDFLRVNFANGDMVGHTGNIAATRLAVECVDRCLARVVEATRAVGGVLIVTADHGNADHMYDVDSDGGITVRSSHSLNPVPFAIFDPQAEGEAPMVDPAKTDAGAPGLANVAATVLELLGFEPPDCFEPSVLGFDDGSIA